MWLDLALPRGRAGAPHAGPPLRAARDAPRRDHAHVRASTLGRTRVAAPPHAGARAAAARRAVHELQRVLRAQPAPDRARPRRWRAVPVASGSPSDFIRIDEPTAPAAPATSRATRASSPTTSRSTRSADARVVSTRDDLPDNVPLNEPPGSRLHGGRPSSATASCSGSPTGATPPTGTCGPAACACGPGQRVRSGQMLARVGNSGQSGGAHLHFQLSDGPHPHRLRRPPAGRSGASA